MCSTAVEPIEELASRRFDLLVVGGGIIGAAVAAHAARAAASPWRSSTQETSAAATSSASSKLVHGGLRYLRLGDLGLVREAHHERRILTKVVAPHLVRRTPFLFPLYRDGPFRPAFVQSGIVLYSALARSRLNWLVAPEEARERVPSLRLDGLRSCALYADATTNDARLCILNVRAAAEAGAVVLNGAEVVALRSVRGRLAGRRRAHRRRDRHRRRPRGGQRGRPVGGPRPSPGGSAGRNIRAAEQGRPRPRPCRRGMDSGAHDRSGRRAGHVRRALGRHAPPRHDRHTARRRSPRHRCHRRRRRADSVRGVGGTRPCARRTCPRARRVRGSARSAGRDGRERERETRDGLQPQSRWDAQCRRRKAHDLPAHRTRGSRPASPGARDPQRSTPGPGHFPARSDSKPSRFPKASSRRSERHLLHLYGGLAQEVLAPAAEDPSLLERLHPDGPDIVAQVLYAATHERARTAEDVLRRRTTCFYRGLETAEVVGRVERVLAATTAGGSRRRADRRDRG